MKSAIYETHGKAREYCELALNHYAGCSHACAYCYAPAVLYQSPEEFRKNPRPRLSQEDIANSAARFFGETRPVLLSFLSDPYQLLEEQTCLTRNALVILRAHGLRFSVLTKGGKLAQRDFDLYGEGDSFGATLTFLHDGESRVWEPGAALPGERLSNLIEAHARGIRTWVSLEPVVDPYESLAIIAGTCEYVDHYKVGKLNYSHPPREIDWKAFAEEAAALLRAKGKGFYIKIDLARELGVFGGLREGVQLP